MAGRCLLPGLPHGPPGRRHTVRPERGRLLVLLPDEPADRDDARTSLRGHVSSGRQDDLPDRRGHELDRRPGGRTSSLSVHPLQRLASDTVSGIQPSDALLEQRNPLRELYVLVRELRDHRRVVEEHEEDEERGHGEEHRRSVGRDPDPAGDRVQRIAPGGDTSRTTPVASQSSAYRSFNRRPGRARG